MRSNETARNTPAAECCGQPMSGRGMRVVTIEATSGPTEARCRTTTYRLKAPGCRWNPRNAQAIAALTTLQDSGQWQIYWQLRTELAA